MSFYAFSTYALINQIDDTNQINDYSLLFC